MQACYDSSGHLLACHVRGSTHIPSMMPYEHSRVGFTASLGFLPYTQEAAQLFGARMAVRHEMAPPEATERAAYFGPVLAQLALPPPPQIEVLSAPLPQVKTLCERTVCSKPLLCQTSTPIGHRRSCSLRQVVAVEHDLHARTLPCKQTLITLLHAQLPKAPEAAEALAEAERRKAEAEAKGRYDADVAAVRDLRMGLRDVTTKLLCDRRWRSLALPVMPQEDPEYWERVGLGPLAVA